MLSWSEPYVHAVLFEECKWYNTEKLVSCREVFCTLIQTILYILIKMYPTKLSLVLMYVNLLL